MKSNEKIMIVLAIGLILIAVIVWLHQSNLKPTEKTSAVVKIDTIEDVKGLGYSGQRKIAVDKNGAFFISYRKKYQSKYEIFVAKAASIKNGWKISGTSRPISAVGSDVDQRVPSIAIDAGNDIHVVWYGSDSSDQSNNRQVKYSGSMDGGTTWSAWKNISVVTGYNGEDYWQEHPYILAGADGFLYVVWEGKDANDVNQQIKFSRSSDGGKTWSAWKNVQPASKTTQSRPTLVQDKNGRLHLFMYSSLGNNGGRQQVQYAWSDNWGDSWNLWQSISDPNDDSRHIAAAADPSGNIHVVWRAQNSVGHSQIMYRVLNKGSWSGILAVASSPQFQFFPDVSVNQKGEAEVVWMESSAASGLPTEDPQDGKVYSSSLVAGKFSPAAEIGTTGHDLYPHVPANFSANGKPVIYESQNQSSQNYDIIFKLAR